MKNLTREALEREFADLWGKPIQPIPDRIRAVVVLVGPTDDENRSRLTFSASFYEALDLAIPLVVLSAPGERLRNMAALARAAGIDSAHTYLQDCGIAGQANTKTQFEAWRPIHTLET